jgi:CheY-like chemotaxis protein
MAQILVGGDNEDTYSICETLEQKTARRNIPVVFCATPHEVLANVGRGGVLAIVLNFEKAGLTNFELAHRIRETGEAGRMPILMPEVDALGDIGALGKQVGIFALPVDPEAVAALACSFMEAFAKHLAVLQQQAAAKQQVAAQPAAKAGPRPSANAPAGGKGATGDLSWPQASQAGDGHAAADAGVLTEAEGRSRRIRHRTWAEVRQSRRGRPRPASPSGSPAEIDDEDIVVTETRERVWSARKPVRLAIALLAVALALGAYHAVRAVRASWANRDATSPGTMAELMCTACGASESRSVQNIHQVLCRKCGGVMGFAYHCNDCKTDFAFVPRAAVKRLKEITSPPECRKCKSWNTKAIEPSAEAPD